MQLALSKSQLGALLAVLLIYPVIWLDAVYGVFSYLGLEFLRVSLLYRMLILLAGLYLAYTTSGPIGWLIKGLVLAWALLLLISSFPDGNLAITKDINHLSRRIYPFTVMLTVLYVFHHFGDQSRLLLKGMGHYAVVFALVMLFSFFTGLGYESYGDHAFGIKSFFVAGNDIGLAALLGFAILFSQLYYNISIWNLCRIVITLIALMLLGTKAGWAASALIAGAFTIVILLFLRSASGYQRFLKWSVMSLILTASSGIAAYVYKNFETFEYQFEQAQQLLDGTSPRQRLIEAYKRNETSYDASLELVGDGAVFYEGLGREYYLVDNNRGSFEVFREVEQEWYDLTGGYGVPYAVFVFAFHGLFIFFTLLLLFRLPTVEHFALALGVLVYLGHGVFAGHAFVSGQPSHLVGIIYAVAFYRLQQHWQEQRPKGHEPDSALTASR